jgi:peptide/nickel transport system permease protein
LTTTPVAAFEPPRAARRRLLPSGGFGRFALRRLVALVFLSLGITLVAFVLTELVPSNAVATNLGEQAAADPAAVAAFRHHYGLDRPFPIRYAIYLDHLVHGDLGQSTLTHGAVTHDCIA